MREYLHTLNVEKTEQYYGIFYKLSLAAIFALLTGVAAQIKFFLPFTPVPVTLQTFTVLLAGVYLGKWWGSLSQLIYVVLGVTVIPWFSQGAGGIGYLFGPTGGYIVGFILAAFFIGNYVENHKGRISSVKITLVLLFANLFLIHLPGLIILSYWVYISTGKFPDLLKLILLGSAPFIPGDVLKIFGVTFSNKFFKLKRYSK